MVHVAGLLSQIDNPPNREKIAPIDPGYNIIYPPTWGGHRGLVVGVFDCGPTGRPFESALCRSTLTFPHDSMGKLRPWHVQLCLCDWAHNRSRATFRKE